MNQENSSEITVEGKETNPAEGETCQDVSIFLLIK